MSCAACADRNVSSVQSVAFGCRWPTICSLEWPRPRKHHHHNNSNNNNNNNEEEEEEEEAGNGYGQLSHQVANGETFHTQRERERERRNQLVDDAIYDRQSKNGSGRDRKLEPRRTIIGPC